MLQREFLTSQLSAASLTLATLSSALCDAQARLRRSQRHLRSPLHQQLDAAKLLVLAAVKEAARLEGVLARRHDERTRPDWALGRLLREHRGMRAQRKLMPEGAVSEEECGYLRVEVEMGMEAARIMRKEVAGVPRIDDQSVRFPTVGFLRSATLPPDC